MVSFYTHLLGRDPSTGYGYAGQHIVKSLQELDVRVPFDDPNDPVQLNFCQPQDYKIRDNQYTIGYTPWESTRLQRGWVKIMNLTDEVWTTSPLIAKWYEFAGVEKPIYVYEHGIDHVWKPFKRSRGKILKFLHVGEPAPRKCGQMVVDAFRETFGNDPTYQLTIKASGYNTTRSQPVTGSMGPPDKYNNNIKIITDTYTLQQMVSLYNSHHILVYPSWGEGFGFIPLQAMGSGMPVIMNTTWAPYKRFSCGLDVKDKLVATPWPDIHPGMMLEPDYDSLKDQMIEAAVNFDKYNDRAFEVAPQVHREYDWLRVTALAFKRILEKFPNISEP